MKAKLTHLQKLLLCSAAGRDSGALLLSDVIGEDDARARSAARGLMQRRFIVATQVVGAEYVWKADGDIPIGYTITDAGLAAIKDSVSDFAAAPTVEVAPYPFFIDEPEPNPRDAEPRRRDILIAMLSRAEGASIGDVVAVTGWLPHTVRAALTNLRRQNYLVESDKLTGMRIYRATMQAEQ